MKKIHEKIQSLIKQHGPMLTAFAKDIHANPEVAFEERHAVEEQIKILQEANFKIFPSFCGLETAYKATWGDKGPCFMFVSEYDALPDLGHACGHNLIATAALAAALATKEYLEQESIPGIVMIVGTPGEEGHGGKIAMVRERAFLRVDAAMMLHPGCETEMDSGSLLVRRFDIIFHGVAAHASMAPGSGRSALDGVNMVFAGVNAWRQYLPEASRVHGIINNGGKVPNVIPDYATCRFYLRAENEAIGIEMEKRFKDIVKGAALISGTKYRIQEDDTSYKASLVNHALNKAFFDFAEEADLNPKWPTKGGRGSTDFGNLSQVVPGAHIYYKACNMEIAPHSVDFQKMAGTDSAISSTLSMAAIMSETAIKFFTDEKFRQEVKSEFDQAKKSL